MLTVLSALKGRIIEVRQLDIDNTTFKLHYRITVLVLISFSLLVTSRQYIGDPIECMLSTGAIPQKLIDEYCWITTTFTLPDAYNKIVGKEVPHPGIDKYTPKEDRVYHQYYQWVCFVLFLQALCFFLPHLLWKAWEGGRMKALCAGLKVVVLSESAKEERKNLIISYFQNNLHSHNLYYAKLFICEVLNLANVIGQIYFTDYFLGGEFTKYGSEVLKYTETDQEYRSDPMVRVFPRVTKCTFHWFGSSGDIQRHDALCVLPINIINEKIYVILWFWFVILTGLTALKVLYRLCTMVFPTLRICMFRNRLRLVNPSVVNSLIRRIQTGDWYLLCQMKKNIDCRVYVELVTDLASSLDGTDKNGSAI